MIDTVTIVWQYHYPDLWRRLFLFSRPKDQGSVWLFAGDGSADLAVEGWERNPGWFRLAGPIDLDLAAEIHTSCKAFFESCGIRVIDDGRTD